MIGWFDAESAWPSVSRKFDVGLVYAAPSDPPPSVTEPKPLYAERWRRTMTQRRRR